MTDKPYRAWIQTLPSCITGRFSEWLPELGEWRNPACHVRRANTFGTGYKADYCCIPLTNLEHDVQSRNGELMCLWEFLPQSRVSEMFDGLTHDAMVQRAKDWFDAQVVKYREMWRTRTGEAPWEAELTNT